MPVRLLVYTRTIPLVFQISITHALLFQRAARLSELYYFRCLSFHFPYDFVRYTNIKKVKIFQI